MTEDLSTPHRPASRWWNDRWAWRGALAAGPLGALAAILHALIVLRAGPPEALIAYAVGGLVAAGIGALLAGPLGAAGTAFRHRHCTPAPAAEAEVTDEAEHRPAHGSWELLSA